MTGVNWGLGMQRRSCAGYDVELPRVKVNPAMSFASYRAVIQIMGVHIITWIFDNPTPSGVSDDVKVRP